MTNERELYRRFTENCNIRVRDKVRVIRTAKTGEMGYGCVWTTDMNSTVDHIYTVTAVDPRQGIMLDTPAGTRWYPWFVLEPDTNTNSLYGIFEEYHAKCELKTGNLVKLVRTAEEDEYGWAEEWPEELDDCDVGDLYRITNKDHNSYEIEDLEGDNPYWVPWFVLEFVEDVALVFDGSIMHFHKEYVRVGNLTISNDQLLTVAKKQGIIARN